MKHIKFGIVGYGKMGKIRAKSISSSKYAKLVAVNDVSTKVKPTKVKFCKSFSDLLKEDIDAVFISGYAINAAEYTIKALQNGKHVFCEKPPSINVKEILNVIKNEKKSRKILKYGFNHRYHHSVQEAKKIIKSKKMGKILLMRGIYGKAGSLDFDKDWRQYKKFAGGGILMDQGIHMLDLFRYFSEDEFTCKSSMIERLYWNIEFEDNAFIMLKSSNGLPATMHSSATQWKHKFLIEIILEKGYLILDGILSATGSYAPEKLIVGKNGFKNLGKSMGRPSETTMVFSDDRSWDYELEEFIDKINSKAKIEHGNSKDALEIMKLTEDIYSKSL